MTRPEHLRWLKANGHDLAPLTGTDARALAAIAACWRLEPAPELQVLHRQDRVPGDGATFDAACEREHRVHVPDGELRLHRVRRVEVERDRRSFVYTIERRSLVVEAVANLALVMQPSTRPLAKALIPWAMDWSDEEPVWALVEKTLAGGLVQ